MKQNAFKLAKQHSFGGGKKLQDGESYQISNLEKWSSIKLSPKGSNKGYLVSEILAKERTSV